MTRYEDGQGKPLLTVNPVKRLTEARAWYRVEKRRSYIKDHELGAFLEALENLPPAPMDSAPDYFRLVLFTGLRRNEAAMLKWENVDLTAKTFTIINTKNKESLTLPMSTPVYELFQKRFKLCRINPETTSNPFVFPANGKSGYFAEPKGYVKAIKESSGVDFSTHDLRRTFATIAESLDIGGYALKRLLNHKQAGDVTAGYIVHDAERLRAPIQAIADAILTRAGRKAQGSIIPFHKRSVGDL